MRRIVIVGCGVVGAAIAYEVSRHPEFEVTVVDRAAPASGSTTAALGIAMAVSSQRVKGRNWRLRQQSLDRYQSLLPELESLTGQPIGRNTQGIVTLCFEADTLARWRSLQDHRQRQGYRMEIWSPAEVSDRCPHLNLGQALGAVYSPQDFQVNPGQLTQALVTAARRHGANFILGEAVEGFQTIPAYPGQRCTAVHSPGRSYTADAVVLAAGLGTLPLTQHLQTPLALGPVLGQGARLELPQPLGHPDFQPVINGHDRHLVPLGQGSYWVGATVEFPPTESLSSLADLAPQAEQLDQVIAGVTAYCPGLVTAQVSDRWFGLRPRPQHQAAPVIQPLEGFTNIWLATGHYRNGVLLAPATALEICDRLVKALT